MKDSASETAETTHTDITLHALTDGDTTNGEEVTLCVSHQVDDVAGFTSWVKKSSEQAKTLLGKDNVSTTLLQVDQPDDIERNSNPTGIVTMVTISRFTSKNIRQQWLASTLRQSCLQERIPYLADSSQLVFEAEGIWSAFAKPPQKQQPSGPPKGKAHGPPTKWRLLMVVWLGAALLSMLVSATLQPLFQAQLMEAVGHNAFGPTMSVCMVSMTMPLVLMVWVPICLTFVCPSCVRSRPKRDFYGKGKCGAFLYWFCIG